MEKLFDLTFLLNWPAPEPCGNTLYSIHRIELKLNPRCIWHLKSKALKKTSPHHRKSMSQTDKLYSHLAEKRILPLPSLREQPIKGLREMVFQFSLGRFHNETSSFLSKCYRVQHSPCFAEPHLCEELPHHQNRRGRSSTRIPVMVAQWAGVLPKGYAWCDILVTLTVFYTNSRPSLAMSS